MAVTLTVNGTGYSFPNTADENWGDNVTNWATSVTSGMLQKAGGTFTLTAEVNFGATYGLKSAYLKSQATNPSSTGIVRLGNTETVSWRNAANSADLALTVSGANLLTFNGSSFLYSGAASIVDADISASAAIAYSKLALTGSILNADLAGSIAYSKLSLTGAILNADLAGSIAYSKLSLTGAILNADLAGSIDYSKLALTGAILNADLAGSIAYSKLSLTGALVNADISASAAIAYSKLAIADADLTIAKTSGLQTALDAKVLKSTLAAKGDIYAASAASTPISVSVGSDGQVLTADTASAAGVKWSSPSSSPIQSYEISNHGIAATVAANALTIALKQADGTDPSTGASAVKIGFRNATAATGQYAQVSATAATSLVISSGSTLGTASGVAHLLYVYAINNAGTIELAVSSTPFDEGTVQSTTAEGGAGAADSQTVLYSTTARTGVAIRLLGRLRTSQATAGTWATAISEISLPPFRPKANIVKSASSGSFAGGAGAGPTDITNLTVTITTNGNPVVLTLEGDGTTAGSGSYVGFATSGYGSVVFDRAGSSIQRLYIEKISASATSLPPSFIRYTDYVAAGTYTYKLRYSNSAANFECTNCILVAREL